MPESTPSRDLTRTVLAVISVGGLILSSFWILQPFLAPLVWATLLVVATWPMMCLLQARLGGRRGLAVAAMLCAVLLVLLLPLGLLLSELIHGVPQAAVWLQNTLEEGMPAPPAWIADIPLVGVGFSTSWAELAAEGQEGLAGQLRPHVEKLARWFVIEAGSVGMLLVEFGLTMILSGLLFARGEQFVRGVQRFARRLAGERGERATVIAAQSIRAVAFGVIVTALVQALVGGVGLWAAGVPTAGMLAAIMFVTSVAQIGAAPVVVLAAVWLFAHDSTGWGIAMLVWALVVGSLDNVLRPILIRRGVELPLLLVFAGVVGGLLAFGLVGLFAGPVVLAVAFTLLGAWIEEDPSPSGSESAG
ncbi:MAG: putative PurR-regulated permease PerM [Planctomycetota bacterium]|jgi:predicted PurR-regulated permease PerM